MSSDGDKFYGSMAAQGLTEIELPLSRQEHERTGRVSESLLVRDVPGHVVRRIRESFEPTYLHQNEDPVSLLGHYTGCLEGVGLIDKPTSKHLGKLVEQFARAPKAERKQFFTEQIEPFFAGMKSARR